MAVIQLQNRVYIMQLFGDSQKLTPFTACPLLFGPHPSVVPYMLLKVIKQHVF